MDDDEPLRATARIMLERLGYDVVLAKDGTEALEAYRNARQQGQPFAAVILDLTIPGGMGGKETIQRLLELDPGVKAIVSSGYATDPIMADHERYGFRGVAAKPYGIGQLGRALHRVIAEETQRDATG